MARRRSRRRLFWGLVFLGALFLLVFLSDLALLGAGPKLGAPHPYFSADLATAQTRFRDKVAQAGGGLHTLGLAARGPEGRPLFIDIAWFGAERPRRVLLHSSGLHGVEAYAGSAVQLQVLERLSTPPDDGAIVLVHVINPYGMAWIRRFNESNVDLNRNLLDWTASPPRSPAYGQLDGFLNPPTPPSHDFFLVKALWLIVTKGFTSLKQAIAGGQYEYPRGLFYGGSKLEQGPRLYREFLVRHLADAEEILAIDVHTGLGEFGDDVLLVDSGQFERMQAVFGQKVTPERPQRGVAYQISGGHAGMVRRALPGAHVDFVTQEFGTYGPIRVLHALREENRWHHWGEGRLEHPSKWRLREAFNPDSEPWRDSILERGQQLFDQAASVLFGSADREGRR